MAHGRSLREFGEYREKMNRKILERGNLQTKRFFNLDTQAYNDGALPRKTKELLGLVASMVLRCDNVQSRRLRTRSSSKRSTSHWWLGAR